MVMFCYYLLGGETAAPSGLYARLCHAFLVILMIARRIIISGSTKLIFTIFLLHESVLSADNRSGPFFPISEGRCYGNQFCGKLQTPPFVVLSF